jgi:hypothetical protein
MQDEIDPAQYKRIVSKVFARKNTYIDAFKEITRRLYPQKEKGSIFITTSTCIKKCILR